MKRNILILIGYLFTMSFYLHAQIEFEEHILVDNTNLAEEPISIYTADIDGDGDMDVLSASALDNKIAWYENINGLGHFGQQEVITTNADDAISVYAVDLDGDGDMDVLSASKDDNKIAWYENEDGLGGFGVQQIITTDISVAASVFSSDIDGDGDQDVLSASQDDNKIAWYENEDGFGSFGNQQIISTNANGAWSVHAIDIDGDGDQDVLSASQDDNKIAWYENEDGFGSFGNQQIISTNATEAVSVFSRDIDGDGDMDVLSASSGDDKIAWYENEDGLGNFGTQQVISENATRASSVHSIDIDDDGDMDVLAAAPLDNKIVWYENTDGLGNFGAEQIISLSSKIALSVYTSDLDGDGDMDVLSASRGDNKIAWYENTDGLGNFGTEQYIVQSAAGALSVFASDVDSDGDLDILSASRNDNKIAWYENEDGLGNFGFQQGISTNAEGARSVYAIDLDGDGDKDVLSASSLDDKIAWYKNDDGLGDFGEQQIITTNANFASQVFAADLDGDGDEDVLSVAANDDKISWFENEDGQGGFGTEQIITTNVDAPWPVFAVDLDGDSDMDILSGSRQDGKIAWYENEDGLGNFGSQQVISTNGDNPYSVYASDLDGDGYNDVLFASVGGDKIVWHKNEDGLGNFGGEQIISANANGAWSVYAIDLDGDGDMDVLSASTIDNKIAWYENIDGLGNFGSQQVISANALNAQSVYAADLDNDGDIDVLSASFDDSKIAWYENLSIVSTKSPTDLATLNFEILPNPTTDITTIDATTNIIQIEIYNSLGQIMLVNTNETVIDLSKLANGIYFCKVKNSEGHFGIRKVVKE